MKKKLILAGMILIVVCAVSFLIIKGLLVPAPKTNPGTFSQRDTQKINFIYPAYERIQNEYKWGYIDNSGKFVIKPQFDKAEDFMENGTARIYSGEKVGLIDRNGKMVLAPEFQYISDFSDGVAVTCKGDKYEVVDQKGKIIFSSSYEINAFHEGIAVCAKDAGGGRREYGYVDKKGNYLFKPQFVLAYDFNGGKALAKIKEKQYVVIDNNGKIISLLNYNNIRELSGDIMTFSDDKNEKSGYLKINGQVLIQPQFIRAEKFEKGYAIVSTGKSFSDEKVGLINLKGEFTIKPEYADIISIGEGLYYVGEKGIDQGAAMFAKKAIATPDEKLLTGFDYYDISEVKNGYICVTDENTTFFIYTNGKKATHLPALTGRGKLSFTGDIIKAELDEELQYYSKDGELIWKSENIYKLKNGAVVEEIKFKPDVYMIIRYPQISNHPDKNVEENINKKLKDIFVGKVEGSRREQGKFQEDFKESYDVTAVENLLVITLNQYVYPFGAAHGMPYTAYYHMNINTGEFFELKDLFKKNSEYVKELSAIVKESINERNKDPDAMFFNEPFERISPNQGFTISKDKMQLFFQPYEIAPYAAGFPTFDISYLKINDIIDKEGDFWKSFN